MSRSYVFSLALALLCVCALAAPAVAEWVANGAPVSMEIYDQRSAVAVSDGAGGAIMAWEDYRDGMSSGIYAQRVDAGGNMLWTANGVPICDTPNYEQACRIVSDGAGGAIIVWMDYRMGNQDVYAQRVDGDGNALWTPGGVAVCDTSGDQWEIYAVSDDAGGAIITWNDYRFGGADVYAQRLDGDGNALWAPYGVPVVSYPSEQYNPRIRSDHANGAIIAWFDYRNGLSEIYAQRIGADGVGQWQVDGVPIAPGRYQSDFSFVCDGSTVFFAGRSIRGCTTTYSCSGSI